LKDDNFINNFFSNIDDLSNNKFYTKYFGASKNKKNLMLISKKYDGLIFRHFDLINDIDIKNKLRMRIERFLNILKKFKGSIKFVRILHVGDIDIRLKKSNININSLDDYNADKLCLDIQEFFDILNKKFNRYSDVLIIFSKNNQYNSILSKKITNKNIYIVNNIDDIFIR